MRNLLLAGVSAFLVSLATGAYASPMNGKTIHNVSIGGISYNVTFLDEALSNVPLAFQFTFGTFDNASAAVNAIITNADFGALTTGSNTVDGTYYSGFIVPYGALFSSTDNGLREYRGARYVQPGGPITDLPFYYGPTNNIDTTGDYSRVGYPVTAYALPDGEQLANLPEPASIAVVALGLFGVGVLRRRG